MKKFNEPQRNMVAKAAGINVWNICGDRLIFLDSQGMCGGLLNHGWVKTRLGLEEQPVVDELDDRDFGGDGPRGDGYYKIVLSK